MENQQLILIVVVIVVVFLLMRKNERLEDELIKRDNYIENITTIMSESDRKIKEIDSKQIFQSDDEIGWFFSGIKEIQELINEYNINK